MSDEKAWSENFGPFCFRKVEKSGVIRQVSENSGEGMWISEQTRVGDFGQMKIISVRVTSATWTPHGNVVNNLAILFGLTLTAGLVIASVNSNHDCLRQNSVTA